MLALVSHIAGNVIGRLIRQTPEQIVDQILKLHLDDKAYILSPVVQGRKGEHKSVIDDIKKERIFKSKN